MSAQEWLDGRILTKEDMGSKQIVHILLRLHKSRPLVNQLLQLNYKIENPYDLLVDWEKMPHFKSKRILICKVSSKN